MFTLENTLYVDVSNLKFARAKVKQYDSKFRYLTIILNDGGRPLDLEGNSVKVYMGKTDGTYVLNDVKYIDAKNGIVEVEITGQMTAVMGIMPCEMVIWDSEREAIMTSYKFEIEVEKTYFAQNSIISENEFGVLGDVLRRKNVKILSSDWEENENGLFECVYNHELNTSIVFVHGFDADGDEVFLASEKVDSMNIKIITDTREDLDVVIDYRFS